MGLMCRMLNGFSRRLFSARIVREAVVHSRLLCFPSLPIGKLKDGAKLSGSCLFGINGASMRFGIVLKFTKLSQVFCFCLGYHPDNESGEINEVDSESQRRTFFAAKIAIASCELWAELPAFFVGQIQWLGNQIVKFRDVARVVSLVIIAKFWRN